MAVIPGSLMYVSIPEVYNPFFPVPSDAVFPGEVANAITEPTGAVIVARPRPFAVLVQLRSKGLSRQGSSITILILFFASSIFPKTLSALTQLYSTVDSENNLASIGI